MTRIKYMRGLYTHGYLRIDGGLHYVTYDADQATGFEDRNAAEAYLRTYGVTDHSGLWFENTGEDSCNGLAISVRAVKDRIAALDKIIAKTSTATRLGREQRAISEMERSFLQNNLDAHNQKGGGRE